MKPVNGAKYAHTVAKIKRLLAQVEDKQKIITDQEKRLSAALGEINNLKASVILADAGMTVARKGMIQEKEIIAPYLEMKARAEAAEREAQALREEINSKDARIDDIRGNWRIEAEGLRSQLAARDQEIKTLRDELHERDKMRHPAEKPQITRMIEAEETIAARDQEIKTLGEERDRNYRIAMDNARTIDARDQEIKTLREVADSLLRAFESGRLASHGCSQPDRRV